MNHALYPLKPMILTLTAALALAACGGGTDSDSARSASAGASNAGSSGSASTVDCAAGDPASADDPCLINRIDQLQALDPSGHYALAADIDASGTLDWNDGAGFQPLASFSGSLDGRGFTIAGLLINRPDDSNVGLFSGFAEGASVRELRFSNARITGDRFVGTLAGNVRAGQIHHVHVDGSVMAGEWAGGLVGALHDGALVSHCSSRGQVQADGARVGGLVGQNDGTISHSFSLAAVRGRTSVGGLVGRGGGRIDHAYSLVDTADNPDHRVEGAHSGSQVGGLVGEIEASARISHAWTVSHAGTDSQRRYAGHRLVGKDWGTGEGIDASWWGGNQSIRPGSDASARRLDAMQQATTYEGWDFADTWRIDEGNGYPDLIANPR
ncbi:MAG: hypothetical protein M0Q42_11850 [Xanthomonadales bacterium]|nr:hypothetical protein [Xanthomonadales bacterium]